MTEQSWPAWCRTGANGPVDVHLNRRTAELYGATTPCRVVTDPGGDHRGWMKAADEATGRPAATSPSLIQRASIFEISFPYGVAKAVERGQGNVVALRIEVER
ncbi:hypothetical protein SEA_CAFASSO_164 [Gordonia phage Cafasso]|uniref:Uncharacterized protein n=1 Tax=Gordonia phage Cafasso TaxID=2851095 RepID=A0AAE7SK76_9CAUD|nr:hypothetical protein SEA_CAFASSO_164 [Gordonia phage Cafasso]